MDQTRTHDKVSMLVDGWSSTSAVGYMKFMRNNGFHWTRPCRPRVPVVSMVRIRPRADREDHGYFLARAMETANFSSEVVGERWMECVPSRHKQQILPVDQEKEEQGGKGVKRGAGGG